MRFSLSSLKLISLIFLFFSCSAPFPTWYYDKLETHDYFSKRLGIFPNNPLRGLILEFVSTSSEVKVYLKVLHLSFPMSAPRKSKITIENEGFSQEFLVDRLEGGQVLLLSEEATAFIVSSLLQCQYVQISSGRFCSKITPQNFPHLWRKLQNSKFTWIPGCSQRQKPILEVV